jgi:hypothetical protein
VLRRRIAVETQQHAADVKREQQTNVQAKTLAIFPVGARRLATKRAARS